MDTPWPAAADNPTPAPDTLADLPVEAFVMGWRTLTGEPPAILLGSRAAMIALLVACAPVAPLTPPDPAWDAPRPGDGTQR